MSKMCQCMTKLTKLTDYTPIIKGLFFSAFPTNPQSLFEHLVTSITTGYLEAILKQHDGVNTEIQSLH